MESVPAMFERDEASRMLGMALVSLSPGHAVVTMTVRRDMLNGFLVAHGGLTFALADTAFAMACNETDEVTLAAGAEISFLRPVTEGQLLTATAERRAKSGRSGIYDVRVLNEHNEVVAEFRGRSRTTTRPVPAP
ncbi:MAG: aromatic compound degradation protein PaaI [Rhodoglobus sp.]|nr:aromatic compound degradation protein PaaI [Rhodoglobus sp.]